MSQTEGFLIFVALIVLLNVKEYKKEAAAKRAVEDSLIRDFGWKVAVKPPSKLRKGFRGLARFLREQRIERHARPDYKPGLIETVRRNASGE